MSNLHAFLSDPNRLMADDGSELGYPTNKPQLYALPALRRRLKPVLSQLPDPVFECLVVERTLVIIAGASPLPWNGPPGELDQVAHGSYSSHGRNPQDPDMFERIRFAPFEPPWVIKIGRIEVEIAPPEVFAGVVLHECMHVLLNHDYGARSPSRDDVQRVEDEAVARAYELGFGEQTAAYLTFYAERFPAADVIMGRLPRSGS